MEVNANNIIELKPGIKKESLEEMAVRTNAQTISHLEVLLERAKKGEITELLCVFASDNDTEWCATGLQSVTRLLGFLEILKYALIR